MVMYAHRSMDAKGNIVRGTMDANNLPDLELRLKRMNLDLIDCKLKVTRAIAFIKGSASRQDLINFCFHMEQITASGIPLLEGLIDLRDSIEKSGFREIVADLIEHIQEGSKLSAAMQHHPTIFEPIFVALIKAGEQSGELSNVFANLCENLKWQDELVAQTKKIIMYPAFVATVVSGVTFFLMIYLVPQLIGFIKNMGGEIPLHTEILIVVSNLFVHFWYMIFAIPIISLIALKLLLISSHTFRYWFDKFKLSIWLIGPIKRKIILSRFATYFGLMYSAGIAVLDIIKLSESIVDNTFLAQHIQHAGQLIMEGQNISEAFQTTGTFPPLVIRMLKVGESTGKLDTSLQNVSYFYNREIKETISRVQSLIEPVMTVILGLLLGWVMLSVLGPIYDLISTLKT